jgi:hypothetical protein
MGSAVAEMLRGVRVRGVSHVARGVRNVGKFQPEYTAQHSRRQSSSPSVCDSVCVPRD